MYINPVEMFNLCELILFLYFRHSAEILSQDDIAVFSTPNTTNLEIQSSQVNYIIVIIIFVMVKIKIIYFLALLLKDNAKTSYQ